MRRSTYVVVLICNAARADDVGTTTEPLPEASYLRLEPSYTFAGGGESSELLARVAIVYHGLGGPTTKLKPAVIGRLPAQMFLSSDGEITITGGGATVPVNLRLGRSFGKHVVVAVGPELVVVGDDRGDMTVRLQLNYVEP